eukprot:Pgem_evm1s5340
MAILALIYLERLIGYTEMTMTPQNWRRMAFGAILLAGKVWDDCTIFNQDYIDCLLSNVAVENINKLEKTFLKQIEFQVSCPPSLFGKYYFDLREMRRIDKLNFVEPLNSKSAKEL